MTGRGEHPQQNGGFGRKRRRSDSEGDRNNKQANENGDVPDIDELARRLAAMYMALLCFLCEERALRCSFPPCMHLVCCTQCLPNPAVCPKCGMPIDIAGRQIFASNNKQ